MIDDENFELRKKFIDLLQKLTNNDILLILTENLLTINHIGERTRPATNVEKTNKVFTLLPDSSIPLTKNLSIWFVYKNEIKRI